MLTTGVVAGISAVSAWAAFRLAHSEYRIVSEVQNAPYPQCYVDGDASIPQEVRLQKYARESGWSAQASSDGESLPEWATHTPTTVQHAHRNILHAIAAHAGSVSNADLLQFAGIPAFNVLRGDGAAISTILSQGDLKEKDEATETWEHFKENLALAGAMADASYTDGPLDEETNLIMGRYACTIASAAHVNAVRVGYKIDLPRRAVGSDPPCRKADCSDIYDLNELDLEVNVVFRGSSFSFKPSSVLATIWDWLANVCYWIRDLQPSEVLGKRLRGTHSGFYRRFNACWPLIERNILDTVAALRTRTSDNLKVNVRMAFAGHSQGAALASLAALAADESDNLRDLTKNSAIFLFTFASPAIIHSRHSDPLQSTRIRHFRFVVDNDPVASDQSSLGSWSWLYRRRHLGDTCLKISGRKANINNAYSAHTLYRTIIETLRSGRNIMADY